MSKRIVIVGGGSSHWSPKLLADLMLTPALADQTYVLHDLSEPNLSRIGRFAIKLARTLGVGAQIEMETDPERALAGADYVLITISTGGLESMAHDLAVPEAYGVYHTVGDSIGPGGWSRTLRNVPPFVELAERINRLAPRAYVLNYTNPMAQLTRALGLRCARPVVGLCHGLFENLEFLKGFFGLASEDEMSVRYAGLNHFFWITGLTVRGEDGLAWLRHKLESQTLPELRAAAEPGVVNSYVADELYRATGLIPYLADRHTSEFFSPYLTSAANLERYRIKRTSIADRQESLRRAESAIEEMTAGGIPERYRQRSRETAADIMSAIATGRPFIDVGNLPNAGQVANLPRGVVVETPVVVTPSGFDAVAMGELPEPARTWVERCAQVQEATTQAALSGDLEQALAALALDPLCAHLTWSQVREMGLRLLRATAQWLPQFAGRI